jgi:hypothetical protein
MNTMTASTRPGLVAGAILALAVVTAACGGGAAPATPGPTTAPSATAPVAPDPTTVPGGSADPGEGNGSGNSGGGTEPGNPGDGQPIPVDPGAGGGIMDPEPTIVSPAIGVTGIRAVGAAKLEVSVDGRKVAVRIAWWSGVEPCSALAGVAVARDGQVITLTINEGSAAGPDVACTMQLIYKATIVDLGELEPGTYTIVSGTEAAPVEVTISG